MNKPRVTHINLAQLGDFIANDWDTGRRVIRVRHLTREMYGEDKGWSDLAQSVAKEGIKDPLFVAKHGKDKYLIDGHHRAVLAQEFGIDEIPITMDWRHTE